MDTKTREQIRRAINLFDSQTQFAAAVAVWHPGVQNGHVHAWLHRRKTQLTPAMIEAIQTATIVRVREQQWEPKRIVTKHDLYPGNWEYDATIYDLKRPIPGVALAHPGTNET